LPVAGDADAGEAGGELTGETDEVVAAQNDPIGNSVLAQG
jgi:hypothetical protein